MTSNPTHSRQRKLCNTCKTIKQWSEFCIRRRTNKPENECLACRRVKCRAWRLANRGKIQNKVWAKKYYWNPENHWKIVARSRLAGAIINGTLKRLPCKVCGNPKSEAHHEDYGRPTDVTWLCRQHHADRDRGVLQLSQL